MNKVMQFFVVAGLVLAASVVEAGDVRRLTVDELASDRFRKEIVRQRGYADVCAEVVRREMDRISAGKPMNVQKMNKVCFWYFDDYATYQIPKITDEVAESMSMRDRDIAILNLQDIQHYVMKSAVIMTVKAVME